MVIIEYGKPIQVIGKWTNKDKVHMTCMINSFQKRLKKLVRKK